MKNVINPVMPKRPLFKSPIKILFPAILILLSFHCGVKTTKAVGARAVPETGIPNNTLSKNDFASVRSIDPSDTGYADLAPLKTAVGDARIVLLGEQSHGEGSVFLAKTRVIKFLHEKMGFEVLAFESGFYDCAKIWQNTREGGDFSREVIGSLFYMYATSHQMQPLFDYIQARVRLPDSLVVAGFESQHTGMKSIKNMFPDFEDFLRRNDPEMLDSNWNSFRQVSVSLFGSRAYRPAEADKKNFFEKLARLKKNLPASGKENGDHFTGSPGFWYRVVCSIESQALRYWGMVEGNEVSVRDLQMAENLIWLAEQAFPGKKIIVWAHNGHIAKNTAALQSPQPGSGPSFLSTFEPMGATIHKHFGDKAYCIGFSGAEGRYMDFNDGKILPLPALAPESIEGRLSKAGYAYAFLDYRRAGSWARRPQQAKLDNFDDLKGIWPNTFDGMFFIDRVFPVDR